MSLHTLCSIKKKKKGKRERKKKKFFCTRPLIDKSATLTKSLSHSCVRPEVEQLVGSQHCHFQRSRSDGGRRLKKWPFYCAERQKEHGQSSFQKAGRLQAFPPSLCFTSPRCSQRLNQQTSFPKKNLNWLSFKTSGTVYIFYILYEGRIFSKK